MIESDLDALLELNNAHRAETGQLDRDRLSRMIGAAFCAQTNESRQCLLIVFDQAAGYDSPNFLWFRDRFARFVYVDRIIVAASARGTGIARALYAELFMLAQAAGHDTVVCEVNRVPPNSASDAFHAALGFVEAGRGSPTPGKEVRYLKRAVSLANLEILA
jgi:uncharacterized protein